VRSATGYSRRRERLVKELARRGIRDERVLHAVGSVPRELFVKEHMKTQAYGDHALPIGEHQTISQPWIVARMTELLRLDPESSVLEIGTGSGYQTAILAQLARRVYSLERVPGLAKQAIRRLRGQDNVKIQIFDGTVGWSEFAPYDAILVAAAAPSAPRPLLDQLGPGGRMVIPEGDRDQQTLVVYEKTRDGRFIRHVGEPVSFVPLVGRHGFEPEEVRARA
jgi:protein-L-isoaspartate(D-aspartate) O-methyltransferase